jgi:hypothetical protein
MSHSQRILPKGYTVGDSGWQLHLRDDVQLRRPRVHHHEPIVAGALVVNVAHQVPVVFVAVPLDVVGDEERLPVEASGPKVVQSPMLARSKSTLATLPSPSMRTPSRRCRG